VDPTISKTEHVFGLPAGGIAYSDERYDKVWRKFYRTYGVHKYDENFRSATL
jgi:hypothetical protein